MHIETFGLTHTGCVRSNNEDALAIEPSLDMAMVADGMGGANCGEVASALTVDVVTAYLRKPPEAGLNADEQLKEAVRAANRAVWEAAQTRPGCDGMGSTIVLAHWRESSLWIVNVGDSRAYLWRGGALRQLSYDQNVGNDLRTSLGLSDDQIRKYPHHNVLTMAIGIGPDVLIRDSHEPLADRDKVLLCSDGLYGAIGNAAIAAILAEEAPLPGSAAKLIDAANSAGGPDNITVALLRYYER